MKPLFKFAFFLIWTAVSCSTKNDMIYLDTNKQGYKEYLNSKDSTILIEVPSGEFTMGYTNGGDSPPHSVYLNKYYIGKYEITLGQFKKFCSATNIAMPAQPSWNDRNEQPVVNLSWNDAKAYCDWAGLRLPTEAEWEMAARGTDGRKYPWGNEWDSTKCNHGIHPYVCSDSSDGYVYTAPVGSFPSEVSPYGVYDIVGNACEWCNDWYGGLGNSSLRNPTGPPSGRERVIRGGSWMDNGGLCSSIGRACYYPIRSVLSCGVRPAK